jgi:hypothetical protein
MTEPLVVTSLASDLQVGHVAARNGCSSILRVSRIMNRLAELTSIADPKIA